MTSPRAARQRAELGIAGSDGFLIGAGSLAILLGVVLAAVRAFGASPAESVAEQLAGGLVIGSVIAAPGVLALLALRDRPALLLPAAVMLVPMSFLSLAGVTLPLLIPAVMLAVAYGRRSTVLERDGLRPGRPFLATFAVVVLLFAAVASLFVHQDPRSYSTPTGGGSTSDVVTVIEAAAALGLIALALAAGWFLATPRSTGEPGSRTHAP